MGSQRGSSSVTSSQADSANRAFADFSSENPYEFDAGDLDFGSLFEEANPELEKVKKKEKKKPKGG